MVTTDDGVRLVGELVVPEVAGSTPAALVLNGSGPLDRNSNMPEQVLDIANTIASALAEHGVASFRFDKRGVGESGGDYLTTGFERETDDAAAALAVLRGDPRIDPERVSVIGHSAGANIGVRLATRSDWIAGLVLLSGSISSGEEVMRWQSERIAASMRWFTRWRAGRFLREQERVRRLLRDSEGDVLSIDGNELPAQWFREFMGYEPARDLPAIRCPVLAVTGRKDLQVDADDVERMRELVTAPFEGETPAELTHLLRTQHGRHGLDTYATQLRAPMDADLVERIASWARLSGR